MWSFGGHLTIWPDRVSFRPHRFDECLGARTVEIARRDITLVRQHGFMASNVEVQTESGVTHRFKVWAPETVISLLAS
jgi:hypothetical protein